MSTDYSNVLPTLEMLQEQHTNIFEFCFHHELKELRTAYSIWQGMFNPYETQYNNEPNLDNDLIKECLALMDEDYDQYVRNELAEELKHK